MAITLRVENFSCLKDVTFEVAPVTVLIGPQGSGKSLLAKLHYFFCDLMQQYHLFASVGQPLASYERETSRRFRDWFPPTAWGTTAFQIRFDAGDFTVIISNHRDDLSHDYSLDVEFSLFFCKHYEETAEAYRQHVLRPGSLLQTLGTDARIYERSQSLLAERIGNSFVDVQTFIPAGRSFLSKFGSFFDGLKDSRTSLDPISAEFVRLFEWFRKQAARQNSQIIGPFADAIFGGTIRFVENREFVEAADGRRIPFDLLSSGQQEALPAYLIVNDPTLIGRSHATGCVLWYVEEPEAHLFPSAQTRFIEFLVSNVHSRENRRRLTMTTHSPYVLTTLNTYLKAGILGQDGRAAERVAQLVPRDCWLTPDRIRVYGLYSGTLKDLVDDEGLIDGSYSDDISEESSRIFSRLLDIQYPATA